MPAKPVNPIDKNEPTELEQKEKLISALESQIQENEAKVLLSNDGEFRYQMVIVMNKIVKQLNSISQQIYDLNKVLAQHHRIMQDTETDAD